MPEMLKWAVTAPLGINSKCMKSSDEKHEKAPARACSWLATWQCLAFRHAGGNASVAGAHFAFYFKSILLPTEVPRFQYTVLASSK